MGTVKYCLTLALLLASLARAQVVDLARGPYTTLTLLTVQPPPRGTVIQPQTMTRVQRVTSAEELVQGVAKDTKLATDVLPLGQKGAGITNGYSRFECVSPDSQHLLAFGTTPYAILFRMDTLQPLRLLTSKLTSSKKVGDADELKWNPRTGVMQYMAGSVLYSQTVADSTEVPLGNYEHLYRHTSDGSTDASGRLLAMACNDSYTRVLDLETRTTVTKVYYPEPNGVDVSPSGKFLKIDNFFYSVATGQRTGEVPAGHGGWSIDWDGSEWFVSQHRTSDWICAYNPASQEVRYLIYMPGVISGMHSASDKRGYFKGWALISTYQGSGDLASQIFFLQLKSQKLPGVKHPAYGGDSTIFRASNVVLADQPRIVRVCGTYCTWLGYFSEAWASVGPDCRVYWGSNWNLTDNLELYRAEFPADVLAYLTTPNTTTPAPTPTPVVTPTPVPTVTPLPTPVPTAMPLPSLRVKLPVSAVNRVFTSNDNLAGSTANYTQDRAVEIIGWLGGSSQSWNVTSQSLTGIAGGEFDIGALLAVDVPTTLGQITSASLRLRTQPALSRYQVNGREGMPLRMVNSVAQWQPTWLNAKGTAWRGASWRYSSQTTDSTTIGTPWSALPSAALWPKWKGDLPTVLEPITTATARMNWPVAPGWMSVDITRAVQAWQSKTALNRGLYIDVTNTKNQPVIATEKRSFTAGFYGPTALLPENRPHVVVELKPTPTPTPTPVPTLIGVGGGSTAKFRVIEVQPGDSVLIQAVESAVRP